ncbi:MAG: tRNA uridine-5-carboxymethylaminomethyl(34) synthesis enzyme MnmG [Chthonomonadales bacterium]
MTNSTELNFDVLVVGGGHAGCEAALAAARMGCRVALATLNFDRIGHMPCNCSIGGPAKGHLAREIDALGGQMGLVTDETLTHIRWVGTGKGPAVQTLRAHADKSLYPKAMRAAVEAEPNITLLQIKVEELIVSAEPRVTGVRTDDGRVISARSVVITTGTFLNGLMHCGAEQTVGGRLGEGVAQGLSLSLRNLGVKMGRFKTGTTPRIDKQTIDMAEVGVQESEDCPPFSFLNDRLNPPRPLLPCWQTHTTVATHDIIRQNLHLSAMYSGRIEGIGPRYCPSIEDKVVRFAEKESHPVFLEQEEWDSDWIYVQGMSTSLPANVQQEFLCSLPGLKNVRMLRPGYAVEYDMAYPDQLNATLESKLAAGLYLAGQINGTSGYEEAGAQGIVAGINAALTALGREPIILERQGSYIGVLIDDLVTKGVDDPYRMLTSRAEYRLVLRHDNADLRLTPIGRSVGLVSDERWNRLTAKRAAIEAELHRLQTTYVTSRDNDNLRDWGTARVGTQVSLQELLRRPQLDYSFIQSHFPAPNPVDRFVSEQVEIQTKYEGYISRQQSQIVDYRKMETYAIPADLEYKSMNAISMEGREKLGRIRPANIGQASRIPGVTPADMQSLLVLLERGKRQAVRDEEPETQPV